MTESGERATLACDADLSDPYAIVTAAIARRGPFVLALLCGCGNPSAGTDPPEGDWLGTNASGTLMIELGLRPFGGGYTAGTFAMTSATTANLQTDDGSYDGTATSMTFTPTRSTCPGPLQASTASYAFQGANLVFTGASGVTTFAPTTGPPPTEALAVTVGCFDSTGNFTPHPFGPVGN